MILANARLPGCSLVDMEIAGSVIAALHEPGSVDQVGDCIDLAGALLRDPDHPTRLRPDYDAGDHLHPTTRATGPWATRLI